MHLWIFVTLAVLLCSPIFAAPQNQDYIPNPVDVLYESVLSDKEENSIKEDLTTEKNNVSLEQIATEKHTNKDGNSSEDNFSTQSVSQSEGAPETTSKEALAESEATAEDIPTKNETISQEGPAVNEIPSKRQDSETKILTESETKPQQQTPELSLTQTIAEPQETASETPSVSGDVTAESTTKIPRTTKVPTTSTKRPKPSKPKPLRATTALPPESPVTLAVTARPTSATVKPTKPASTQRYPCRCADGTCSCCSGIILENFNVPLRSRACANVTYEPDDFAFNFRLAYNDIVLYNRRMSAKNPRPACIPINRYFGIKMCAKLSNVYMSGRNMHACLDFEGFFDNETAFKHSFNCFRIGSQGVAIVRPEDGGGLPPPPDVEEQTDEDYDDSARGWTGEVEMVPN